MILPTASPVPPWRPPVSAATILRRCARATAWDDEEPAALSYQQQEAERRHRALMERYGRPVSLNAPPPEHVAQARGRVLAPFQVEAIERARLDALRRRNEPFNSEEGVP